MNRHTYLLPWIAAAVVVLVLPHVFSSGASITMMSLMGFAIIFALSFNMLLGQTGMLSFGHAVYYGLGGFMTAHALNVSLADVLARFGVTVTRASIGGDLWMATVAQVAPIIPYLLLVLILIFRPKGLMGDRDT